LPAGHGGQEGHHEQTKRADAKETGRQGRSPHGVVGVGEKPTARRAEGRGQDQRKEHTTGQQGPPPRGRPAAGTRPQRTRLRSTSPVTGAETVARLVSGPFRGLSDRSPPLQGWASATAIPPFSQFAPPGSSSLTPSRLCSRRPIW